MHFVSFSYNLAFYIHI